MIRWRRQRQKQKRKQRWWNELKKNDWLKLKICLNNNIKNNSHCTRNEYNEQF